MPKTQKYRVDTDHGSYEVEVEVGPDATSGTSQEAPGPSAADFLGNVGKSSLHLIKGAGAGLKAAVTQNPLKTIGDVAGGVVERGKEYANDLHPIRAAEELFKDTSGRTDAGGVTELHPINALAQLLPTEMMYRDPVGVASDAVGAAGLVKGARALSELPTTLRNNAGHRFNQKPLYEQQQVLEQTVPDRPNPATSRTGPVVSPSTGINDLPLAQQMEMLPSHGGTAGGRSGMPLILPQAGINDLPLARQMEMLPSHGGVAGTRAGSTPLAPQTGINDLPLAQQMEMLPSEGGTPSLRTGESPQGFQGDINSLPLFQQQQILEGTGVNRPVIDTGRRGADLPPSREVAPTAGIAEQLGVQASNPLDGLDARIGGSKLDLNRLPEAARQRILDQLDPQRAVPSHPTTPDVSGRTVPPSDAGWKLRMQDKLRGPDQLPTLNDTRRLEMHGSGVAAADPNFQQLAKEFGLSPSADTVRDLTGTPARTPLAAETAGLDRDFSRHIMDERGSVGLESDELSKVLQGMLLGHMMRGMGIPRAIGHTLNRAGGVLPPALGAAGAARLNHP